MEHILNISWGVEMYNRIHRIAINILKYLS